MDRRRTPTAPAAPSLPRAARTLGERVRELRRGAELTQADLAGDRFSKEYISQIEKGKTSPTPQTVQWLAERLDVDVHYLETGVASTDYESAQAAVVAAEAAIDAKEYAEAVAAIDGVETSDTAFLHLRRLLAESWARMYLGELRQAVGLLDEAREVAALSPFSELELAEVAYRLGCCRYKLGEVDAALALFTEALTLARRSGLPADRLQAHVLEWRSRCYRRRRDWEAAREDIDQALELAQSLSDEETVAHVYFQASLVAERNGSWVRARAHAEQARELYEAVDDRVNVGRQLNNLGGFSFLLGRTDEALRYLKDAFAVALEVESTPDAAQAVSSLAQVHLRTGELELAERHARHALQLLGGRVDFLDEIGNAQLVLGRALLEQGRTDEADEAFATAETCFAQLSSVSHVAGAWTAQGDLAARRGDETAAAALYRRAAEALAPFELPFEERR